MKLTILRQPFFGARRPLTKTIQVVKITAFLLLVGCLQLSARGLSQGKITITEKGASLETILKDIRKQTGYQYLFVDQWEQETKKIDIAVSNATLEEVLDLCFKDQPFSYTIIKKMIVIKKKEESKSLNGDPPAPGNVKGRVTNEQGEPLVGATVTIKKLGKSGTTNEKGEFVLQNVPNGTYTVEISYVGYEKFTSEIVASDNTMMVNAELKKSTNRLDEVQVIAYGTTTERFNTGNVSVVKAEDIEKQPVNNPLLALEGRVPGLVITQAAGLPGSGVTVQIQGQNSIGNGNDPFYVIDGVPYTSQLLPSLNHLLLGTSGVNNPQAGNPLSYINPSDIESISVLKDADATAIYGSRAANGAILITTKKGKAGQTKADINMQSGWGQVTRKLDLLNTQQYLQMRHEALNNDGITASLANGDYDLLQWDTTRYTDWQKALIGGTAQYTNVSASVSGGTTTTQYIVGGTYHRETTVFPGHFADQKGSLHFNINSVSANQKFRLQLSGNYLVDNNQLPGIDLTNTAITLAPNEPSLYNADGSLNWAPSATGTSTFYNNPLSYLYNKYTNKANNLISNAVFSYQVLPGLDVRSSFGYTNLQINEIATSPLISTPPEARPYNQSAAQYGNNNINSWIIESQVSYKRVIGKGRIEALVGTTINQNNSNGQQLTGIGYNSDLVLEDIRSAASVTVQSTIASLYKYNALFGRLSYNWDDKYLINLTARRDGSSRFGAANQFHNFGAAGIGWIFSKEAIIRNTLPFLSFGKLRASYGTTGNDQIGDYQFLNLYRPTYAQVPYQGATGLAPNGLANPYLQWEETKKLQFGLEVGFLKDRILLNTNYFQNRSSNQLLNYVLPIITGFVGIARNFPATVQNKGWEFTLTVTNVKTRDFTWSTHINLTLPQNKLVAFPNLASSSYAAALAIGQPITIQHVFHLISVNDTTGIYQFADSKGNPTYNPSFGTDYTVIINTSPKFYGGFQNSFSYKGFQLDFLFQFVKQKALNYFLGYYPGTEGSNQPVSVLSRWQKPGDIAPIQRYNSNYGLFQQFFDASVFSDAAYSDASYIRLKNLSLSWQLPEVWRKKAHLQNARLYMQGQNLLTITKYQGMDPENESTISLPPLRVLSVGVQVEL